MTEDADSQPVDHRSLADMLQDAVRKASDKRAEDPLLSLEQTTDQIRSEILDTYARWLDRASEFEVAADKRADKIVGAIHVLTWTVGILGLIFIFK